MNSTGVTLSKEQAEFARQKGQEMGTTTQILIMNAWDIPDGPNDKKYDRITCVEMSEHIGVKNYQLFIHKVKKLLKDDGLFYLQIAGLRRSWQ